MTDLHGTPTELPNHVAHGDLFKPYLVIFGALSVFTLVSFIVNYFHRLEMVTATTSATIIMAVAVVKATLVAMFFMHLRWDWSKLYFLIIPLMILTVMMVIVLLPDTVLTW